LIAGIVVLRFVIMGTTTLPSLIYAYYVGARSPIHTAITSRLVQSNLASPANFSTDGFFCEKEFLALVLVLIHQLAAIKVSIFEDMPIIQRFYARTPGRL
jgi:hypothetical protein